MKRLLTALMLGALLLGAGGCDKHRGDTCSHRGDVWAKGGVVLHCTQTRTGLVWQ